MGVINLGVLVEALKKKLSGTFVKTTDYASKSKYGIVKIGDGITVSSGKISVTQSGGSVSLYHWDGTTQTSGTEYSLTTPVPDGTKFVVFLMRSNSYPWITGTGIINPNMPLEESNTGWTTTGIGYSGVSSVQLMKSKNAFKRDGAQDVVFDVIAIL